MNKTTQINDQAFSMKCVACGDNNWALPPAYSPKAVFKKCKTCGLLITDPAQYQSDQKSFFDNEYQACSYAEKDAASKKIWVRHHLYNLKLIRRFETKCKKILDFGSGLGTSVEAAQLLGHEVTSVEVSDYAVEYLKKHYNVEVVKDMAELADNSFDVIYISHVLEHFNSPRAFLENIFKKLKQGGYAIIVVPNPYSVQTRIAQTEWAGWALPYHRYHYSKKSLQKLLAGIPLEIKQIVTRTRLATHWILGYFEIQKQKKTFLYFAVTILPEFVRVRLLTFVQLFVDKMSHLLNKGDETIVVVKKL